MRKGLDAIGSITQLLASAALGLLTAAAMMTLAGASLGLPAALLIGLLGLCSMVWFQGSLRRYFLLVLFFVAPFDLSKAVVPPLDRFHSPGLYLSVGHLALLALTICWGTERLLVKKVPLQRTSLDTLAFVYVGWIWLSALSAPGDPVLLGASAMSYTLCVLAYYVVSHSIESIKEVVGILKVVLLGLALQAIHVMAQLLTKSYLPLPGAKGAESSLSTLTFGNQDASAFRPVGAFDHPNALADYLTLLIIPALAFVLMGPSRVSRKSWFAALFTLGVGGLMLLLTLSRGAWAAAVLGAAAVAWVFWRHRFIGSTHLLGAVLAGVIGLSTLVTAYPQVIYRLTEPDDRSTESRVMLNDQAIAIIKEHPLTGAGFGGYNRAAHEIHGPLWGAISEDYQEMLLKLVVHNHYLLVAAQMGIPPCFSGASCCGA